MNELSNLSVPSGEADGTAHDAVEETQGSDTGQSSAGDRRRRQDDRRALLGSLSSSWRPRDIRELASSLLRLADSLEQAWVPPQGSSRPLALFRWRDKLPRIERNAANLAVRAKVEYERRRCRKEHIPQALLGEPAWDMLLDLFMQYAGGAKVSTTSLCIASDSAPSTALRHIAQLEEAGLVTRNPSAHDRRITFVELTEQGVLAVGAWLEEV
jgi:DNA-binding transcriptional ArsR family regulator